MMGKVHSVRILVDIEADNEPGVLTHYEVIGKPGSIYGRKTHIEIKPHYGNPGEGPTQVEVHLDAMLVPVDHEQLLSIVEERLQAELERRQAQAAIQGPIVVREKRLERGAGEGS
ncbi:hypothetical protein PBI_DEWDROP_47 [Microbacterium phage Dewdrop]|nr:hypothetical protein PBI_LEAF_47 [Microbacterium phage Leaf]QGZ17416.1 hypothetical protein PBI_DEWDROP_47 [Microbacterium phage Dewdrop]